MKENNTPRTAVVLLGGGDGTRTHMPLAKQWIPLLGETVFSRALRAWDALSLCEIVVVMRPQDEEQVKTACKETKSKITYAYCGKTRAESAKNGFLAIESDIEFVAFADVARCLILPSDIRRVLDDAYVYGAASAMRKVSDTVKMLDNDGKICATIPRDSLLLAETPQVFRAEDYKKALLSVDDLSLITDDNMLMETIGIFPHPTFLVGENPKLTTKEDIFLFENIIRRREDRQVQKLRIGQGYDVHRFAKGRKLILGGVEIDYESGLLGHSDADVLIHAIMDAILGALTLGDIGTHFPDTDEKYRGVSSMHLLTLVAQMMRQEGGEIVNLDATLVLQKPKVSPYINNMVENIAFALACDPSCVSIKATTEEGLGFTGEMLGIKASAVCLISL